MSNTETQNRTLTNPNDTTMTILEATCLEAGEEHLEWDLRGQQSALYSIQRQRIDDMIHTNVGRSGSPSH